jgi:nitric oxide reductase NorD protein
MCRVRDIEKESLLILTHALSACGDEHAIFTFTSKRRLAVQVETVKEFCEPLSAGTNRCIGGMKPGHYTRIGAAIRHVSARLGERPHRGRLLLVVTDGKPNDTDHYEGRYGIEDTRRAIQEARRKGQAVCVGRPAAQAPGDDV